MQSFNYDPNPVLPGEMGSGYMPCDECGALFECEHDALAPDFDFTDM